MKVEVPLIIHHLSCIIYCISHQKEASNRCIVYIQSWAAKMTFCIEFACSLWLPATVPPSLSWNKKCNLGILNSPVNVNCCLSFNVALLWTVNSFTCTNTLWSLVEYMAPALTPLNQSLKPRRSCLTVEIFNCPSSYLCGLWELKVIFKSMQCTIDHDQHLPQWLSILWPTKYPLWDSSVSTLACISSRSGDELANAQ